MGQAWCKEKTSKAQDSKSPLDRVFVRCAHRIYPSLKEEGSVLGGATQRVTSSEIGYAGSPPRDVLTRGRSIDSVDRPFQPSDWVDVNLEVPSTPRANSVLTNLTIDTNLYPPTTTPTSIRSKNLKDVTPVPPPRRKKRNRGRPLPPKPDEIVDKTTGNLRHVDSNEEPLYSSVANNSPCRTLVDDYATMDDVVVGGGGGGDGDGGGGSGNGVGGGVGVGGGRRGEESHDQGTTTHRSRTNRTRDSRVNEYSKGVMPEGRRTKEIYEHKVNGTGRIISSDVVSGKRLLSQNDRKASKVFNQHKVTMIVDDNDENNDEDENDDEDENKEGDINDEYERFVKGRGTNDSSTPNRNENIRKRANKLLSDRDIDDSKRSDVKTRLEVNVRPKNYSTVSLPNYDELDAGRHARKRAKEEDVEGIGEDEKIRSRRPVRSSTGSLPVESFLLPFSQKTSIRLEDYIPSRGSIENLSEYQILDGKLPCGDANAETEFLKYDPSKLEDWDLGDIGNCELNQRQRRPLERSGTEDRDVVDFHSTSKNTNELQKPMSFGKPMDLVHENSKLVDGTPSERERCPQEESKEISKPDRPPSCRDPSYCLNQSNPFHSDTIEGDRGSDRSRNENSEDVDRIDSRKLTIFGRSLSYESEPNEDHKEVSSCETKELRSSIDTTERIVTTTTTTRTFGLTLPCEKKLKNEDDYDDGSIDRNEIEVVKMAKTTKTTTKTPPPSPENKIKSDITDNEHSILLKVLKEESAEGSNFSSMTPSLTELEVALSDMLEKEQNDQDCVKYELKRADKGEDFNEERTFSSYQNENDETRSIAIEKIDRKEERMSVSLDDILKPKLSSNVNDRRKVSFCAWEEKICSYEEPDETIKVDRYETPTNNEISDSSEPTNESHRDDYSMIGMEKSKDIPTPPRRRHRPSCPSGILKEDQRYSTDGAKAYKDAIVNDDRLI